MSRNFVSIGYPIRRIISESKNDDIQGCVKSHRLLTEKMIVVSKCSHSYEQVDS